MEKNLETLSYFIITHFVTEVVEFELTPNEYPLLDYYFSDSDGDYISVFKSYLTSSNTVNNKFIENMENYIIIHPDQTEYAEWISPLLLGQTEQ